MASEPSELSKELHKLIDQADKFHRDVMENSKSIKASLVRLKLLLKEERDDKPKDKQDS